VIVILFISYYKYQFNSSQYRIHGIPQEQIERYAYNKFVDSAHLTIV